MATASILTTQSSNVTADGSIADWLEQLPQERAGRGDCPPPEVLFIGIKIVGNADLMQASSTAAHHDEEEPFAFATGSSTHRVIHVRNASANDASTGKSSLRTSVFSKRTSVLTKSSYETADRGQTGYSQLLDALDLEADKPKGETRGTGNSPSQCGMLITDAGGPATAAIDYAEVTDQKRVSNLSMGEGAWWNGAAPFHDHDDVALHVDGDADLAQRTPSTRDAAQDLEFDFDNFSTLCILILRSLRRSLIMMYPTAARLRMENLLVCNRHLLFSTQRLTLIAQKHAKPKPATPRMPLITTTLGHKYSHREAVDGQAR